MFRSHRGNALFLFLFSALLFMSMLGNHGLLEPDEGRYSEIPREMMERGDYVTPRLNGVLYFEKPVLHYWLTAAAFAVFGKTEFAARFWPAALGIVGVLVTYGLGAFLYGKREGFASGLVLASSLLYFAMAQINLTDMTVSVFITIAMTAFLLSRLSDRRWLLLFYCSMALAVLSKGLIGVVLPGAVIFCYMVLTRRWSIVPETLYLPGVALFFAITVPWFWAVCRANPDFFHFFFIHEHFLRYATKIHDRYEPFWFFIPILLLGILPWSGFIPQAITRGLKRDDEGERRQGGLFLVLWFGVIFLFFSLSGSKLIPYIIPVIPPLAILIGRRIISIAEANDKRALFRGLMWTTPLMILFGTAFIAYPYLQDKLPVDLLTTHLVHKGIILWIGVVLSWWGFMRRTAAVALVFLMLSGISFTLSCKSLFVVYDKINSGRQIAEMIKPHLKPDDIVAQYGEYYQTVPFYLERRNVLVDYTGELKFGRERETEAGWFIDSDGLERLWSGPSRVILVLPSRGYKNGLEGRLSPVFVEGYSWGEKDMVISNRPLKEGSK